MYLIYEVIPLSCFFGGTPHVSTPRAKSQKHRLMPAETLQRGGQVLSASLNTAVAIFNGPWSPVCERQNGQLVFWNGYVLLL